MVKIKVSAGQHDMQFQGRLVISGAAFWWGQHDDIATPVASAVRW